MQTDGRPDPDALLAALAPEQEESRGRLKIFLGAAPGVGKTFEMLVQAKRRADEGVDVVAGVIETHGRAETAAQLSGLALLPRRSVPYRGQVLEEFDLDAALARKPALLLVDELAHTNAPGSRHAKRWEDVAEILAAGIPVWATLNVQHLESLNDDVARITGIRPSETLPDRVLELADEIEMIDVTPAELRTRLKDGKIYQSDTARRALEGFFKEGNLAALREIALRRAAARVDEDVQSWMRRSGIAGPWPAGERVVAMVGPDAAAESVVRQAKRLADALRSPWVALHIERTGHSTGSGVRAPISMAAQLGAELDLRAIGGGDLVSALLEAARSRNATHLVIGRSPAVWWRRWLGQTLSNQLLKNGPDFVMHVVPAPNTAVPRRRRAPQRQGYGPWVATLLMLGGITGVGAMFRHTLPGESSNMVYLAGISAIAVLYGKRYALLAAFLGLVLWDYFFVPPFYTVTIGSPGDAVTAVVFATIALLTAGLAGRVRAEVEAAGARIEGLRRVTAFSRKLGEPAAEPELMAEIANQAAGLAGRAVVLAFGPDGELGQAAGAPAGEGLDDGSWAAARWSAEHSEAAGRGTSTLPSAAWRFLALRTVRGRLGALGVRPDTELTDPMLQALEALADQAAVAIERVRLAASAARAEAMEETQRLRTALLASLGHDLRTPLTGIQGAASTLRSAWDNLSEATRADLLSSIEDDVGRMARFLANITDLTRLETGQIVPRLAEVPVLDVVEAAVRRMPDSLSVGTSVPAALMVRADPALLEQALFNILDNARKFSPSGGFIAVRAAPAGREAVTIAVADEGVGIPAEDLPHVFDSFFRVRRTDRTSAGLGLGLAIARGLVEAMGGSVTARSPNPATAAGGLPGTVISITMPRGAATLPVAP